jgi:hypothetical protein
MDFERRNVDKRSGNRRGAEDPRVLIGRAVADAISHSPLMAEMRDLSTNIVKSMESTLGRSALHAQQRILQVIPSGLGRQLTSIGSQFASLAKRAAQVGPPPNEMVFAAYDASEALSEGDTGPMDRFLTDYLKLPATPETRKLMQTIISSSLARDYREVRDQWLVVGPKEAKLLVEHVNRRVRLSGTHISALLAYGTSSDPWQTSSEKLKKRKAEELPTAVYFAWSDIQRPGYSSTLVDAVGNYLRVHLAGEKETVRFEDTVGLEDAVGELGQEGKKTTTEGGSKHPLRHSGASQFEIQEFELRAAVQHDAVALQRLVEARRLSLGEVRT